MTRWPEGQSPASQWHSVSLHVMSSCQSLTSAVWPWWLQSSVSSSTQYPASRCPVKASRPKQSRRGKKEEKDYFSQSSPVPMMSWGPSSQMRWPEICSGSAALTPPSTPASSTSSLSTVPQPVYLQYSTTIKHWTNNCKRCQDFMNLLSTTCAYLLWLSSSYLVII